MPVPKVRTRDMLDSKASGGYILRIIDLVRRREKEVVIARIGITNSAT